MTFPDSQQSDRSPDLDSEAVRSVVVHMNSDHSEACLNIVRAFSEAGESATRAQLVDMDRNGLIFDIQTHDGDTSSGKQKFRVNFSKPLRTEAQIRGALVGLARQARQKLAD